MNVCRAFFSTAIGLVSRYALCFPLLVLLITGIAGVSAAEPHFSDTALIIGNGTTGPYYLTGRPLLADTLKIIDGQGVALPDGADTLYRNPARVILAAVIPVGDSVLVLFSALPFSLRETYEAQPHRSPAILPASVSVTPVRQTSDAAETPTPFKLNINGAKTFGISVGNRDETKTRQGLQLSLNGRLTETVELSAAISDRFSDRLSSGATASRLNSLDDFFVALKSPHVGARMGRLQYDFSRSNGRVSRRLSGAELGLSTGGQTIKAATGKLEGLARRVEFFPTAGRQGPYPLTSGRRSVVPNSESVYLDGRRLEPGADRDYTIDYFTGEITFTPHVVLSEAYRVLADFEESAHTYLRRAAFSHWRSETFGGRVSNELGLEWEADDPDRGIGFSLSPTDREHLRNTTGGQLLRDGTEYVGPEKGEYVVADSAADGPIYEYVGPEHGDYNVRFEYIGAGNGSYVHLGGGAFGYIGRERGDFEPLITVTAPTSRMLFSDRIRVSRTPLGAASLAMAGRVLHPNRLNHSSRETDWSHDLAWSSDALNGDTSSVRFLQATGRWRRLGRLADPDLGIATADISRQWYLPRGRYSTNTDVLESKVNFAPCSRIRMTGEYGKVSGFYSGWRDAQSIEIDIFKSLTGQFAHRRSTAAQDGLDSARTRETWVIGQQWRRGWLEIAGKLFREDRRVHLNHGDRFEGYEFGLGLWQLHLTVGEDRVHDVAGHATFVEQRRRQKLDGSMALTPLGITGSLSATRTSRRRITDGRLFRDYLGHADLRWAWPQLGLAATTRYTLNNIGARTPFESFIPVADGFGDYRREDSLFIPDPTGDLVRVTGTMGELRPTAAGQKEFTLRRSYGAGTTLPDFWNNFAADLRLTREERVDPQQISIFGWMLPWGNLRAAGSAVDYTLLRYETSAGLERRFPLDGGVWYMRGRYRERSDRYGSAPLQVQNHRFSGEVSARGNLSHTVWRSWEVLLARQERKSSGYAGLAHTDILSHSVQAIGGFQLATRITAALKSSVEHLREPARPDGSIIYGLSPSATFRFGPQAGRGSLKPAVYYRYADTELNQSFLPGIYGGFSPGHNVRFLLDGRWEVTGSIAVKVRSSFHWFGERRPLYRVSLQAVSKF